MKNSARYQTVIEIIDHILQNSSVPCDRLLADYFRQRRFIGSHDRRFIVDDVYAILRYWPILSYYQPHPNGRQAVLWYLHITSPDSPASLKEIFTGERYGPLPLTSQEQLGLETVLPSQWPVWAQALTPEWLWPYCQDSFGDKAVPEMQALNQPVGFDVRVNTLKTNRSAILTKLAQGQLAAQPTPYSPLGIRFAQRQALQNHELYKNGYLEVQDEGSQLISLLTDARPGMRVLDMCAGAGGKTLALAAAMENKGTLIATDVHEWRLKKARERLRKAGVNNVECRHLGDHWLKRQRGRFDRVLVDAPCSGTGTWRRNPDMKLRFQLSDLQELLQKQLDILTTAAAMVKPGGRLVYATCSVLKAENQDQTEHFLKANPEFFLKDVEGIWADVFTSCCPTNDKTLQLTPARHQTDGFFISIFEKKANL